MVEITAVVARSPDEAEFLAKGGTLVAETERAALEAAEAAQRAAEQAAALFEAKSAEAATEGAEAPATEEAPAEEK
jgi:large subunit ribosomal protein L9